MGKCPICGDWNEMEVDCENLNQEVCSICRRKQEAEEKKYDPMVCPRCGSVHLEDVGDDADVDEGKMKTIASHLECHDCGKSFQHAIYKSNLTKSKCFKCQKDCEECEVEP